MLKGIDTNNYLWEYSHHFLRNTLDESIGLDRIKQAKEILVIGPGSGLELEILRDINDQAQITAIEPNCSEKLYSIANQSAISLEEQCLEDFQTDREFDLIICRNVEILNPAFLNALRNVLGWVSPYRGILLITTTSSLEMSILCDSLGVFPFYRQFSGSCSREFDNYYICLPLKDR